MTNRDREILVDNINVLFHIFSQISNRVTQNNYIKGWINCTEVPSGSPISVLQWQLFCDLCRHMPLAEQHLVQHEDTIPFGCYAEFHVGQNIQSTVKGRMLLLTKAPYILSCKTVIKKKKKSATHWTIGTIITNWVWGTEKIIYFLQPITNSYLIKKVLSSSPCQKLDAIR